MRVDGWGGGWNLYRLILPPTEPAAGVGACPLPPQLDGEAAGSYLD